MISEYCKKVRKENEDNSKFIMFKDKKYEDTLRQNIENNYDNLLKTYIETILKNESLLLYEKWNDKLFELVKKTFSMVNPSFRYLKDSMDINNYVKVKTIPYKDQSLSRVIDGYALQKNVCSKKMPLNIENPSILILNCGLDCYNASKDNFDRFFIQEPVFVEQIKKRIEQVDVDIILVNKNIVQKLQDQLIKKKRMALVLNVKAEALKKIARCTKTTCLDSIELIDKKFILGQCKQFKIEKINLKKAKVSMQTMKNDILKSNEYNLMIFEGCDQVLFSTIILSDQNQKELKIIKKLLQSTILPTIRDYFLQKYLLYYSFIDIPKNNLLSKHSTNINGQNELDLVQQNSSISLIHSYSINSVKNDDLNISQVLNCESNLSFFTQNKKPKNSTFKNIFDDEGIYQSNTKVSFVKMTLTNSSNTQKSLTVKNDALAHNNTKTLAINELNANALSEMKEKVEDFTESDILKQVYTLCCPSEDVEITLYSKDNKKDKPLGQFIFELCYQSESKCKKCKNKNRNHLYNLFCSNGKVGIHLIDKNSKKYKISQILEFLEKEEKFFTSQKKNQDDEINYDGDIFSYGYCKICDNIVTPLIKIPTEMYNISSGKYLKHFFYNKEAKNRNLKSECNISHLIQKEINCNHFSFTDITRIFITQYGNISFSFSYFEKYKIDPCTLQNDKKDQLISKSLVDNSMNFSKHKSIKVCEYILHNFNVSLEEISKIEDKKMQFSVSIQNTVKKIKLYISSNIISLTEFKNYVEANLTPTQVMKFQDYIKCQLFVTKIYIKIVQFKIICNRILLSINKLTNFIKIIQLLGKKEGNVELPKEEETNTNLTIQKSKTQQSTNESETIPRTLPNNLPNSDKDNSSIFTPSFNLLERASILSKLEEQPMILKKQKKTALKSQNSYPPPESGTYINIDQKSNYKYIIDYLTYYDDQHTQYTTHLKTNDISSIIAFAITSEKYQSSIKSKNQFDLTSIKCERKINKIETTQNNLKDEDIFYQKFDINDKTNFMYNYFTLSNEACLSDSSLIFDINRNTYYNSTMEKKKILQQLETELLSDEKNTFVYKMKSIELNKLTGLNVDCSFVDKKQLTDMNLSNIFQRKTESDTNASAERESLNSFLPLNKLSGNNTLKIISNECSPVISKKKPSNEDFFFSSNEIRKIIEDLNTLNFEIKSEKLKLISELNIPNNEYKLKYKFPKLNFIENSTEKKSIEVFIYFSRQFEALRIIYCSTYEEFILSSAKSHTWDNVSGGKSSASFCKSIDNKYVLKCINKDEFRMFTESAYQYFHHLAKHLFHKMPSALAKILGAYKIKIKKDEKNIEKYYVIIMENAFYNIDITQPNIKAYDLKGSTANRYVQRNKMKPFQVLPDTNFKEERNGEPIVLERGMMELLSSAVHNDSLILSKINVIDYSLLLIKNEADKTIRVKIIDYIRKYTWDKQLEHVGKTIINGLNSPTIVSPVNYRERFGRLINDFFIGI